MSDWDGDMINLELVIVDEFIQEHSGGFIGIVKYQGHMGINNL